MIVGQDCFPLAARVFTGRNLLSAYVPAITAVLQEPPFTEK
jgi:hypothetical protein